MGTRHQGPPAEVRALDAFVKPLQAQWLALEPAEAERAGQERGTRVGPDRLRAVAGKGRRYTIARIYAGFVGGMGAGGLLALRLVIGAAFVLHGWPEVQNPVA